MEASSSKLAPRSFILPGLSTSGLTITLHPLPILNISEHYTRTRLQQKSENYKIIGALIGIQKGREVEIVNSYELAMEKLDGGMDVDGNEHPGGSGFEGKTVDWAFFEERRGNFKQVFPTLDFLGWYSVGVDPSSLDLSLHNQFTTKNDTPLFLQLSPTPPTASSEATEESDLPLTIYETVLHAAPVGGGGGAEEENGAVGGAGVLFQKTSWKIETGEAERVAVEGVGKAGLEGGKGESSLVPNLTTQRNALQMLSNRTQIVLAYVRGVSEGTMKQDPEILRMISGLMAGLPVEEAEEFKEEFLTEYADVQLTTYLANLTKSLHSLNNATDKFTLLHAPAAERNGMGGFESMMGGGGGGVGGGGGRGGGGMGGRTRMGGMMGGRFGRDY